MTADSRAVVRCIQVLEQLSVAADPLTNERLARTLGVPPSSMHRLLKKLQQIGYVEFDPEERCYAVGAQLGRLAERLADIACRSLPIRQLLGSVRSQTGHYVSVWVRSGPKVRLSAVVTGTRRGRANIMPGEIRPAFSTPGIAIAANYAESEVRRIARLCRVRREPLGRDFSTVTDVVRAVRLARSAGYASGYNIISDGWGILAWPIPITLEPIRYGALSVGAPVEVLRKTEGDLIKLVNRERERYLRQLRESRSAEMPW